jgi:Asp-tRNA(Asn)/Glu-tRNA(Gln) amidotransferase A subunit family amidase
MKVMISQPMKGKSTEQIRNERESAVAKMEAEGHEVVDTVFDDFDADAPPLKYLARAIDVMADCEGVVFIGDWTDARGCRIEHEAAVMYDKAVIEYTPAKEAW